MIHGYVALRRQLRQFLDSIGINWNDVSVVGDFDDDGKLVRDDGRAEILFKKGERTVEMVIFAPSTEPDHKPDGKNVLPLGKIAARINGRVVSGPIDQETWANIRRVIHE